jgi:chromosome segregation ATPase
MQRHREYFVRYVSRRDILIARVKEARNRLAGLLRAVEEARARVEMSSAASTQAAALEAAVCTAAQRVAVLRASLDGDESTLAGRVSEQASRVRVLQEDVAAARAALAAAEAEAAASSPASRDRPQDNAEVLRASLEQAKRAQQEALESAAHEHETLVNNALANRGRQLHAATTRGEAEVAALSKEEASLRREAVLLQDAVEAKKSEAEAASVRHRGLVREVEQLKGALAQAEAADSARMETLYQEVAQAAAQVSAIAPAGHAAAAEALASSPALIAAERAAAEDERRKWDSEIDSVRGMAEGEVEQARTEGQRQYQELVGRIEKRYQTEFDTAERRIREQRHSDGKAINDLERRLREVEAATEAARADREALLHRAGAARKKAQEKLEQRAARLRSLRKALKAAWERADTPAEDVLAFLRRVQSAVPYTESIHGAYDEKLRQLRFSTPLLQAITRKEVLDYRIQHMRRQAETLLEKVETDATATAQLEPLREQYQTTIREQEQVQRNIAAEAARYRREFGREFMHRGMAVALPVTTTDEAEAAAVDDADFHDPAAHTRRVRYA